MNGDDDDRIEVASFNKVPDYKLKFMRSKGLFPLMMGSEFDEITMNIFSYVGIKKRAYQILMRLNSKGY